VLREDRLGTAQADLRRARDTGRTGGVEVDVVGGITGLILGVLGLLDDAEADARLAFRTAPEVAGPSARRWTVAALVRCLVERGELTEAEEVLGQSGVAASLSVLLEARGHLRMAQGRAQDALEDLMAAGAKARRQLDHPGLVEWRPAAALAMHHVGRSADALALADEALEVARRFGAPRPLGLALRAKGMVGGSVDVLHDAVNVLATTPSRLEHARALVDLGAALRRGNSRAEAKCHLEAGMHGAHGCGAAALVAKAREELVAAGARPRRPAAGGRAALTPSELRVVQLAADGLGNREIAHALFVTTKTVETHLGAAYRKLGVSRRAELADALP
jgi:DNA-binding CsgD family transcriptional regulator